MSVKALCIAILLGLLCQATITQAATPLNVATVPIASRTGKAYQAGLLGAFTKVLIKISGNPSVATIPQIENALPSAKRLLRSYSYQQATDANGQTQLYLIATFDAKAVDQILRNAGQAIWKNRPLTLVWLKVSTAGDTNILSSNDQNDLTQALQQAAAQRGISLLLPTMDLQDQSFINTTSPQKFDLNNLQKIAQRYNVPAILAGDITKADDGNWQAQWVLLINGSPQEWQASANSQAALMAAGINNTADTLASQFAALDNQNLQSVVKIAVSNVSDLDDYAKVLRYLKRLPSVSKVSVSDMSDNGLLLQVSITGNLQTFQNTLHSRKKLIAIQPATTTVSPDAMLYFRWRGKHAANLATQNISIQTWQDAAIVR